MQVTAMKNLIGQLIQCVAVVGLAGGAVTAYAHHSTAMYDYRKTKTVTGTVKEFQWTNPHMFIKVLVPDASGNTIEWNVECGTPNINARHGWKKSDVKAGDRITLEINPLRDGSPGATLQWVQLPDGRKLWGPAVDIVTTGGPPGGAPPPAAP
jgi:hypothetical protein